MAYSKSGTGLSAIAALLLAACASTPAPELKSPAANQATDAPSQSLPPLASETSNPAVIYPCAYTPLAASRGGFYKDDGPQALPEGLDRIPDPLPRLEPLHRYANRQYSVLGQTFTPRQTVGDYNGRGIASWYGRKFHGQKTSSGEVYDMFAMTAAHPTLPIPSYARVTNLKNGRSVTVRINDRGPFLKGREIDLSFLAACRLGYAMNGSSDVEVVALAADGNAPIPAMAKPIAPFPGRPFKLEVTPPKLKGNEVYLQFAAFSDRANADTFVAQVARELDEDAARLVLQQSGEIFRVRMGPFADRASAQAYAEKLTGGKKLEAVIAR